MPGATFLMSKRVLAPTDGVKTGSLESRITISAFALGSPFGMVRTPFSRNAFSALQVIKEITVKMSKSCTITWTPLLLIRT